MASPISKITLNNVLPDAFRDRVSTTSDIWLTKKFEFVRGHFYSINAASGVGKSSLCTFIYGARRDYAGTITFDDKDVRSFKVNELCELRKTTLAWLPQELLLFPELTVIENIQLKNRLTDRYSDAEIREMLQCLSIDTFYNRRVGTLSLGQQQRVAAVRTLCQPFGFLLLDEPVSHLDEVNNKALGQLVSRVADSNNAAVITTSVGYDLQLEPSKVKRINL